MNVREAYEHGTREFGQDHGRAKDEEEAQRLAQQIGVDNRDLSDFLASDLFRASADTELEHTLEWCARAAAKQLREQLDDTDVVGIGAVEVPVPMLLLMIAGSMFKEGFLTGCIYTRHNVAEARDAVEGGGSDG